MKRIFNVFLFVVFGLLLLGFLKPVQASQRIIKTPALMAQLIPTVALPLPTVPVNGVGPTVATILNGVVPTVANTVNNVQPTVVQTVTTVVNSVQPTTPPNRASTSSNSQQGSGTTQYSNTTTSNTYRSTTDTTQTPQTNSPIRIPSNIFDRTGVLFLTAENTASGKVVLNKDITEVIFGADSLSHAGVLTFIMPADKSAPILFDFSEFLLNDASGSHVLLPQAIRMDQTTTDSHASVFLPMNEDMRTSVGECEDDVWDGTINALTILPQSEVTISGKRVGLPLEIGRSDCSVNLSQQANIVFTGNANWQVGYRSQNQEKDDFTEIASYCPTRNHSECYTDEGSNLVVKTYHFTQFFTFKKASLWDWFLTLLQGSDTIALIAAGIVTLVLALLLGNFSILRKVGSMAEADAQKSEYVSMASHELRTPMTAIKGWLSMILRGDFGPIEKDLQKPLEEVNRSTQRSLAMVNDILDMSKIESGKVAFSLTSFPIDGVISEVITSLLPLAKEKGVALEAKNLESEVVQGDRDKVRQVITNLVANALKYTDSGSVSVSAKESKDVVHILVSDTGPGISKEDQHRLFHKFERIATKQTEKKVGTGLGLYISRELARRMGGDIELLKSEMGVGSTFVLSLLSPEAKLAKKLLSKG